MKRFILVPLLFFFVQLQAQKKDALKYAASINTDFLKKHLTVIAGEEMQGRETGTEGQRKAAAYIEKEFKEYGLKPITADNGYQQFYPLYKDSMISCSFTLNNMQPVYGSDYICPANSNESGTFNSNEIIFAGYGIEDEKYNDYASLDVKGKTVILFLGEPKKDGTYILSGTTRSTEWTFPGLSKKLALAAQKGAAAVFVINPAQEYFNARAIENSKATPIYYPRISPEKKAIYITLSHAFAKSILGTETDKLISRARAGEPFGKVEAFTSRSNILFNYNKYREVINASNVAGLIEGTDKKDEYIFLTAHYDHLGMRDGKIYYGADDDGSGTVAVMQMAAAFAKAKTEGNGPRRTIVFMAFSGEEKGLLGSEYYSDHPLFPLEKTSVDLNTDMIGRIDTEREKADSLNYVYVVGHDKLSSDLPPIIETINKEHYNMVLDYKFDDPKDPTRIYFRSDHYNFARKGVPVLFFYDGMLKSDYHKPTDTVDKIYWSLFEKRTRFIFHTAWEMANRNEMLKRDIPLPESARNR